MIHRRLSRRTVLRGAGSIAIALPWLEIMGAPRSAQGAGFRERAQRFVTVYTPGGTVRDKWLPTGTENDFQLSPILAPLQGVKEKLLVLDGLDMVSAKGEQHQAGILAWLTGAEQSAAHGDYARGPSVDQVIATKISAGQKPRRSIEMALRWATGKSHGRLHPINAMNFEDNANFEPIPPRIDPVTIWGDLFGALDPNGGGGAERLARRKSILDYVGRRYDTLSQTLGSEDRIKLERHLAKIREIELTLDTLPSECEAPELIDTSDYDPYTGLNSANNGSIKDQSTDAAIPKVGKLMMDMIVMALACDITAVASLQWSDTEAKHTFPWLSLPQHHHFYQHDGGFRPAEVEKICTWYAEQHAYLLGQMDEVDMGGHTLLDESIVYFGSELSHPPTHQKTNMPFLLAGRGGGLRSGRFLTYSGESHNKLLVSLCNLCGDDRTEFGDSEYNDGALGNLT